MYCPICIERKIMKLLIMILQYNARKKVFTVINMCVYTHTHTHTHTHIKAHFLLKMHQFSPVRFSSSDVSDSL